MTNQKPVVYDEFLKKIKRTKRNFNLYILISIFCFVIAYFANFSENALFLIASSIIISWIFGFILLNADLKDKFLKEICLVYNFSSDDTQQENTWDFIEELEKFKIYNSAGGLKKKFLFSGNFCNRAFNLYQIQDYDETFFLVKTNGIKDFKNTILIEPKDFFGNKHKELQKADVDTQGLFEIFTDNPKEISTILSKEFLDALKLSAKKNYFLITPQGILFTQTEDVYAGFSLLPFSSSEKQVKEQWQKVENFLKLLDLINLLEKK